jgi:hypothetical protein
MKNESIAAAGRPWMNTSLSPDERARLLEAELTLDERIHLLHAPMAFTYDPQAITGGAIGAAGYVLGIERLGVPALHMSDASRMRIDSPSGPSSPARAGTDCPTTSRRLPPRSSPSLKATRPRGLWRRASRTGEVTS